MNWLGKLLQVLMEFISKTFSKKLFKTALWKEQWLVPFVEHPVDSLLSAKVGKNKMVKHIALSTNGGFQ